MEGQLYISMEYVDGQTLDDLIRTMGRLSPLQTASLGRQICAGLQAVHDQGIVHRDLKPSNVMVDRAGHAIVMDFGMAYHPEVEKLTRAGMVVGTLAYVAPEQARGKATDARSDVYALGLLLYEMLTGRRPPGDGAPLPLALRDAGETCPPPSHFAPESPAALDEVVMRCLSRDPSGRQATVTEVGDALGRASEALATTIYPPAAPTVAASPLPPAGGTRASPPRRLAALLGVVLVGAGLYAVGELAARADPPRSRFVRWPTSGRRNARDLAALVPLYLSDELRARKGCRVAPFASTRTFETGGDPRVVAKQLEVGFVVQGQVRSTANGFGPCCVCARRVRRKVHRASSRGRPKAPLAAAQAMADWIASEVGVGPPVAGPASAARLRAMEPYLRGLTYLEGWDVERNYALAERRSGRPWRSTRASPKPARGWPWPCSALPGARDAARVPARREKAARAVRGTLPDCPRPDFALGVVQLGRGRPRKPRPPCRR